MAGLKLERFARAIAMHDAVCDGVLSAAEWTVRPQQDATIALTCGACGQTFREQFALSELAGDSRNVTGGRMIEACNALRKMIVDPKVH